MQLLEFPSVSGRGLGTTKIQNAQNSDPISQNREYRQDSTQKGPFTAILSYCGILGHLG